MFGKQSKSEKDLEFFTIFDSKSKAYDAPIMAKNKETLLRDILNDFNRPEVKTRSKHFINAEDYSVFRIGSFDLSTGLIQTQNLEHIINLHDIRAMCVTPDPGIVAT